MSKPQKGIGFLPVLLVIVLTCTVAGVGWYVWDQNQEKKPAITNFDECAAAGNPIMESYPEQCAANGQTFVNEVESPNNGWNTTANSGLGGFTVTFPDGWAGITKPMDSDWFIITGQEQPEVELGAAVEITESDSYGSDSPSVFSLLIHDNFADPEGTPSDFTLTNGKENSIKGTKYTKIFEEDSLEGAGIQRFKGDRNYTYVFPLERGEELRIYYSIYGSDPRNNLVTVEAIIETIRLNQ